MSNNIQIKEIFTSIQGEGPYIGYNQLFIRFSNCNLKCNYCDTDYKTNLITYSAKELANIANSTKNIHSVSLTGGEPLYDVDFLITFLPLVSKKIYLETNGTLAENLEKVIKYTDMIAMDIKLNSCTKSGDFFDIHEKFINIAITHNKEIFLKAIFDENITNEEIDSTALLAEKYHLMLILQPKMNGEILKLSTKEITYIFNRFNEKYNNVRLIPQVHKFINVQ